MDDTSIVKIRRADLLPASIQKEIGIYDGLVEFTVGDGSQKISSPVKITALKFAGMDQSVKNILSVKSTLKLFSERLNDVYFSVQLS